VHNNSHVETNTKIDKSSVNILVTVCGLYILIVVVLGYFGYFCAIRRTTFIPLLIIIAMLSRRGIKFINDWAIFLSLIILFDYLRGFVFAVITHFQLPVYATYVIQLERMLGHGHIFTNLLQGLLKGHGTENFLDHFLVIIHGSHYVIFLLLGLAIWLLRPADFQKYTLSFLFLIYTTLLVYLVVPTVPPWMAAESFKLIPAIDHITPKIYNIAAPSLLNFFDSNPIAAMPSLHAAFPILCTFIAFKHFKKIGYAFLVYTLLMHTAIVYLGEHYLVDVIAGLIMVLVIYMWVYSPAFEKKVASLIGKTKQIQLVDKNKTIVTVTVALMIIFMSQISGMITMKVKKNLVFNTHTIEREFGNDCKIAESLLFQFACQKSSYKKEIMNFKNAFDSGKATDTSAIQHLLNREPDNPELLFWQTYFQFRNGEINEQRVLKTASAIEGYHQFKFRKIYQHVLETLVTLQKGTEIERYVNRQ
jgi:hypothetical protein